MAEIYDLTLSLSEGLTTWPGDPELRLELISSTEMGQDYNVSLLRIGSHTGTHVDAPRHVGDSSAAVDELPLDVLVGDAWVCRFPPSVKSITADHLEEARIPEACTRVLLSTSNSALWDKPEGEFQPDFVCLAEDAAEWLLRRGIRLVGIDYLSIGQSGQGGLSVHRTLLSRGTVIVEGLDLRKIPGGPCRLCCLPLKLKGGDGAPARVVALR